MNHHAKTFPQTLAAVTLLVACAIAAPAPAHADSGADFLKQLEGSWRGRGSAMIPGRKEAERVTCQVSNRFEDGALNVEGECASTQGKTRVSGRLDSEGSKVSGSLINAFKGSSLTRSTGAVEGGRLVVSSNYVQDATNQLTRTRQVVRMAQGGFTAEFFTWDNATGQYEPAGDIRFSGE